MTSNEALLLKYIEDEYPKALEKITYYTLVAIKAIIQSTFPATENLTKTGFYEATDALIKRCVAARKLFIDGNIQFAGGKINNAFWKYKEAMKERELENQLLDCLDGFNEALKKYDALAKLDKIEGKIKGMIKEGSQIRLPMLKSVANRRGLIAMLPLAIRHIAEGKYDDAFSCFQRVKEGDKDLLLKFITDGKFKKALKQIKIEPFTGLIKIKLNIDVKFLGKKVSTEISPETDTNIKTIFYTGVTQEIDPITEKMLELVKARVIEIYNPAQKYFIKWIGYLNNSGLNLTFDNYTSIGKIDKTLLNILIRNTTFLKVLKGIDTLEKFKKLQVKVETTLKNASFAIHLVLEQLSPLTAPLYFKLGNQQLARGNIEEAFKSYNKAMEHISKETQWPVLAHFQGFKMALQNITVVGKLYDIQKKITWEESPLITEKMRAEVTNRIEAIQTILDSEKISKENQEYLILGSKSFSEGNYQDAFNNFKNAGAILLKMFVNSGNFKKALKKIKYPALIRIEDIIKTTFDGDKPDHIGTMLLQVKHFHERIYSRAALLFQMGNNSLGRGKYDTTINIYTKIKLIDTKLVLLLKLIHNHDFSVELKSIDTVVKLESFQSKFEARFEAKSKVTIAMLSKLKPLSAPLYFMLGNEMLLFGDIHHAFLGYTIVLGYAIMEDKSLENRPEVYLAGFKQALQTFGKVSDLEDIQKRIVWKDSGITKGMLEAVKLRLEKVRLISAKKEAEEKELKRKEEQNNTLINLLTGGANALARGEYNSAFRNFALVKKDNEELLLDFIKSGRFKRALSQIKSDLLSKLNTIKNMLITIPPETQSGRTFRLRGKGVKALRSGGQGDLLCKVTVETPVKLTTEQRAHIKQFEALLKKDGKNHSPKAQSWFDAVKRFFK